jgi:hypothetical protein
VVSQQVSARRRSNRLGAKHTVELPATKRPPARRHRYRRAARMESTPEWSAILAWRCRRTKEPKRRKGWRHRASPTAHYGSS